MLHKTASRYTSKREFSAVALSPIQSSTEDTESDSNPNDERSISPISQREGEGPAVHGMSDHSRGGHHRRPRRSKKAVSYAEPPLNRKLRRGDEHTFGNEDVEVFRTRTRSKRHTSHSRKRPKLEAGWEEHHVGHTTDNLENTPISSPPISSPGRLSSFAEDFLPETCNKQEEKTTLPTRPHHASQPQGHLARSPGTYCPSHQARVSALKIRRQERRKDARNVRGPKTGERGTLSRL